MCTVQVGSLVVTNAVILDYFGVQRFVVSLSMEPSTSILKWVIVKAISMSFQIVGVSSRAILCNTPLWVQVSIAMQFCLFIKQGEATVMPLHLFMAGCIDLPILQGLQISL